MEVSAASIAGDYRLESLLAVRQKFQSAQIAGGTGKKKSGASTVSFSGPSPIGLKTKLNSANIGKRTSAPKKMRIFLFFVFIAVSSHAAEAVEGPTFDHPW